MNMKNYPSHRGYSSQNAQSSIAERLQGFAAKKRKNRSGFAVLEEKIRRGGSIPDHWDLRVLHELYNEMREFQQRKFIEELLPNIVDAAEKLQKEHKSVMKKLAAGTPEVELTRGEVACILANCFLCKFRNPSGKHDPQFVQINFIGLYSSIAKKPGVAKEKIKCLLSYFETVLGKDFQQKLQDKVKYQRKTGAFLIDYCHDAQVQGYKICKISDFQPSSQEAQVSFSNKKVGGGVLGNGSLQEEIKFITCPELIVARIFCREMSGDMAVIVSNALQFSNFEGYADSFKHRKLQTPPSSRTIICIDAIDFSSNPDADQYSERNVHREIVKAIAGFSGTRESCIASGYWGCGAFKGDPVLKVFVQVIAATVCGKKLHIYTNHSDANVNAIVTSWVPNFGELLRQVHQCMLHYCQQAKFAEKSGSSARNRDGDAHPSGGTTSQQFYYNNNLHY